jgi:PEGA domain
MVARRLVSIACLSVLLTAGCGQVRREMTLESKPAGAVVYLNGEEVGRTPCTVNFTWYGEYDLALRKEGYQSLKTTQAVVAPWWQWVPIDLMAELTPGKKIDRRTYSYTLTQEPEAGMPPAGMVTRAGTLKPLLESGEFTRKPTSRPATLPATNP